MNKKTYFCLSLTEAVETVKKLIANRKYVVVKPAYVFNSVTEAYDIMYVVEEN